MRILSIAAGAGGMYCGSCLRDNAVAAELIARGHAVTLLPLYTPLLTDEPNVSRHEVLFGGISVYLQQHARLFRRTPRFLDRLWDSPRVISAFARRSGAVNPRMLGELTVSMLDGYDGVFRKEFDKLLEWIAGEPPPDIVNLPNSLLISLARPIRQALQRPICCTLQGEDLFLDGLRDPYRQRALESIRRQVESIDRFIAISEYYARSMSLRLDIPGDRVSVVPLGINLHGYRIRHASDDVFRVGYLARLAPEKGLHRLVEAYVELRRRTSGSAIRLEVAGYLPPEHAAYLNDARRVLEQAGLGNEFTYHGALDRDAKLAFLATLDVLSVPATYDEPKGMFLLEAMASAVPVVQPRRGAFIEIVEKTGGGVLVAPDNTVSLTEGLYALFADRARARWLGERGAEGVRGHYAIARSADSLLEVYADVLRRASSTSAVGGVPADRALG
jgi:glycosyltransferase involved in cell wall biosynthesis